MYGNQYHKVCANHFIIYRAKTYVENLTGEKVTAKH